MAEWADAIQRRPIVFAQPGGMSRPGVVSWRRKFERHLHEISAERLRGSAFSKFVPNCGQAATGQPAQPSERLIDPEPTVDDGAGGGQLRPHFCLFRVNRCSVNGRQASGRRDEVLNVVFVRDSHPGSPTGKRPLFRIQRTKADVPDTARNCQLWSTSFSVVT